MELRLIILAEIMTAEVTQFQGFTLRLVSLIKGCLDTVIIILAVSELKMLN